MRYVAKNFVVFWNTLNNNKSLSLVLLIKILHKSFLNDPLMILYYVRRVIQMSISNELFIDIQLNIDQYF